MGVVFDEVEGRVEEPLAPVEERDAAATEEPSATAAARQWRQHWLAWQQRRQRLEAD
ncbi:hypothetical protein ACHHRT_01180 [Desulfurivibrio sp. D14AmB]|uniref:hypothetical protein n=1 Tax=Desulfurivibrio sp. D14AmB TaxID=3374370 RepID=UPI00376EC0E0